MVIVHFKNYGVCYIEIISMYQRIQDCFAEGRDRIVPDVFPLKRLYFIADTYVLPQNIDGFLKLIKEIPADPFVINYRSLGLEASYTDAEVDKMLLRIFTEKEDCSIRQFVILHKSKFLKEKLRWLAQRSINKPLILYC